jgi:hypothetical protein
MTHREDTMVHLVLVAAALQLRTAALPVPPLVRPSAADSVRDARHARDVQARFERLRRLALPWESGSAGRCDVRVGRFCWWYEDGTPAPGPEAESIARWRTELLAELDALGEQHPGDDWLAGMRVHYRVDARRYAAADSAARSCVATRWWCDALVGYAGQARGDARTADSAFAAALAAMPDSTRCSWSDIATLLPGDSRGRYQALPCPARRPLEERYWMLARPRLGAAGNEWRTEFFARRVQSWLASRSLTPQTVSWGRDADELLLRFGWPVAWGRVTSSNATSVEAGIVGHDPSPSFAFGPREPLLDTLAAARDDGWDLRAERPESRYAPARLRRLAGATVQLARFRRGDSTLVVAAYSASDDSLGAPRALLAASVDDGRTVATAPDSATRGTATLVVPGVPRLAGVEVTDTATGTLARSRMVFAPVPPGEEGGLSDLLLYRPSGEPAASLDSALAHAIAGDTVGRSRPLGLFWESYGVRHGDGRGDLSVTVERIDHGWLRSARQRLRLEDPDSPLRMRWSEPKPAAEGASARAISLDLGGLAPGRYRISIAMNAAGGRPTVASREIELLDR